ncbi:MAG: MFS transporter [Myxacorys chilensis ATA2-1-KO14]|jgi:fucose permease|nr:MFS transporter [Myxacorys chilensis ATA2-1-KO14]
MVKQWLQRFTAWISQSLIPHDAHRSQHPAWIGIALSLYAFIAIGVTEGGLGVLLPSIVKTYNLTPATVTFLFISQIGGYVTAAIASSLLSARIGLARMLLLAGVLLTSAVMIYALSPFWWLMIVTGVALGLGIGLIDAGINTYIVSDSQNANLIGILHGFYGVGALLGPAIATTLLALGFDWRLVYLVIAAIVGIFVLAVLWIVSSNYRPMSVRRATSHDSTSSNLRLALQIPAVLLTGLLLLVYVGTESAVGNWAYTVEAVSRGTSTLIAGYSVSAYWLGLTLGRFSLGYFLARLGASRTINFSLLVLTIGLLLWWLVPGQWLSLPLIGFALAPIFPATIWLMPQRVPSALVPAAIGFVTSVASLGAATIPTALGWIAASIGLASIPVVLVGLAIALLLIQHQLTRLHRA